MCKKTELKLYTNQELVDLLNTVEAQLRRDQNFVMTATLTFPQLKLLLIIAAQQNGDDND